MAEMGLPCFISKVYAAVPEALPDPRVGSRFIDIGLEIFRASGKRRRRGTRQLGSRRHSCIVVGQSLRGPGAGAPGDASLLRSHRARCGAWLEAASRSWLQGPATQPYSATDSPLGDGLSFSAHRRCDRAATKRSSASTFTRWRHCLIIGRRTLVFMISSAKVSTSDDIVVPVHHAIAEGRRSCPVAIRSHSWFVEGRIVAEWERTGCSWEQGTAGERGVGSQSWAVNCMQLSLQETETEVH
jgi:hypothetical protein